MATELDVDLEGLLSDVEATIDFTNPDDLAKTFQEFLHNASDRDFIKDHTVLITGFPIESFTIDDDEPSPIPTRSRKALYFQDSQILLLTMPGGPHEVAARKFGAQLGLKLNSIGCFDDIVPTGGMTVSMNGVKKEADASWGPLKVGACYATCVVEASVSESSRALACNAKIWLEHNESHVTQVITVKIHPVRPEILFTVWTKAQEQRDIRAQYPPRAVPDQEMRITLEDGRPVADGRLCLSFEKLFERQPRPGTAEGDLVFSARELGEIARLVWTIMGFSVEQ